MSEWNGAAAGKPTHTAKISVSVRARSPNDVFNLASGESWNDGGSDGWKGEQSADGNANNISMHANGDFEGGGNAADGGCRK